MRSFFIFVVFFYVFNAHAADKASLLLQNQTTHMNHVLEKISNILFTTGDFLSDEVHKNNMIIEATLSRYSDLVPAIRAILVVDADGNLLFDSFNKIASRKKVPSKPLNLRDRIYFKNALLSRKTLVHEPVTGRTSGVPFLPVTRNVYAAEELKYVVIAVVAPGRLIHPTILEASYGGIAIYNENGALFALAPQGTEIPPNFFASLEIGHNETRHAIVPWRDSFAHTIWSSTNKFGLVSVFSEIKSTK